MHFLDIVYNGCCELKNTKNKGEYELAIMTPMTDMKSENSMKFDNAQYLGRHILAEFFECDPNVLNNPALVEKYMLQAALECGATVVTSVFICLCLMEYQVLLLFQKAI